MALVNQVPDNSLFLAVLPPIYVNIPPGKYRYLVKTSVIGHFTALGRKLIMTSWDLIVAQIPQVFYLSNT
jgi:hypothetical protein